MKKTGTRIGMASAYFSIMKGGGEHYTLYLSNALADLGYDVTIICGKQPFKKPEPLSDRFEIEYVPQLYFLRNWGLKELRLISGGAGFIHSHQYMFYCYKHLFKNHCFDIIHTHDPASLHAAVKIKEKYQIPIISTFHGHPFPRHIKEARNVDAILPVSKEIKFSFEKHCIKNVYDVPGGVDLSHFKPMNKKECKEALGLDGKIILFVGRLIPIKNLYNLLRAFREVQSMIEDTKLLMVGDGALKESLIKTVKNLGLRENVVFTGAVSYRKLPTYYNAADVFVLPSIFESYPLVALEAIACGIPIVISTGANAFIEDFGKDALFIITQQDDPEKISESIIRALEDRREIEVKVCLSQKRIKLYDWEEKARKVAKIYDKCLEN